jgi:hypothetical protein
LTLAVARTLGALGGGQGGAPDVSDPESTRTVYLVIAGLVVLAGLIVVFTVWFWRATRPESASLARLEVMGLHRWEAGDDGTRRELLDRAGTFAGGEGPLADDVDGSDAPEALDMRIVPSEPDEHGLQLPAAASAQQGGSLTEDAIEVQPAASASAVGDLAALVRATPPSTPSNSGNGESEMDPLFEIEVLDDHGGPGTVPGVWHPVDRQPEDASRREADDEFLWLLQLRGGPDEDPPEQERFALPGEPLV